MFRIALIVLAVMLPLAACAPGKLPNTKVGKPYSVNGKTYYPTYDITYDNIGEASWYGPGFHGNRTASGETYDQHDLTAAHPTLPMPSLVRVTNLGNGKNAIIRVNDRGPFAANRIIDLSKKSAQVLGIGGVAHVRVQYLPEETEDYIRMVKEENEGRILRMADYHHRIAHRKTAQMMAAQSPAADGDVQITAQDVPAPEGGGGLLIKSAMAEEPAENPRFMPEDTPPPLETMFQASPSEGISETALPPATPLPKLPPKEEPVPYSAPAEEAMPETKGAYAIQLGSFASEENARKLAKKLSGLAEPSVAQVEVKGKTWWRVRIEGLKDRYSADTLASEVRASGVPEARVVRP